ncbi:unnamed protein product [[Actinomadura] parvosata subsp. kistnae]|uniref:Formate hydrogenlyase regulatory protein HycA n=1 Tax=[Actinomadura] parvosata subsp. kistnae TaxID=1909395 RepID=A0A1V0A7L9_9ACTN|nr:hypothetical protein [Nonomuraea sp. ATCC 55076]AQZ66198.1 hypothetical protein BKM31_36305 [Nonomuraea sp. ATCC 55076]SPL97707.1 unnamed protein product [Actinomadura parvosata subsp. kistnae]
MAVPEVIPMSYEPDYHTGTIGHWAGGQFLGSVVAAFRQGYTRTDDWLQHKRWYAVLHTFDAEGRLLASKIECTGSEDDHRRSVDTAQERMAKWLGELDGVRFADIAVRPFRVEFDGVVFGLVVEEFEGEEHAELYPNNIGFYEPWDGLYDT